MTLKDAMERVQRLLHEKADQHTGNKVEDSRIRIYLSSVASELRRNISDSEWYGILEDKTEDRIREIVRGEIGKQNVTNMAFYDAVEKVAARQSPDWRGIAERLACVLRQQIIPLNAREKEALAAYDEAVARENQCPVPEARNPLGQFGPREKQP